ncbi:MAG: hypothetical protein HY062_12510 [Bacteroidetes bacterium]|nr:hypothetical protein [Bacteroidota bacterium]
MNYYGFLTVKFEESVYIYVTLAKKYLNNYNHMKIKVGTYDAIFYGTVIGNENEPIDFLIAEEIGFIIRVVFKTDPQIKEATIKAEKFDKVGAQLNFINFNDGLPTGNSSPIQIGNLNGRELYLNYRVSSLTKGGKSFDFTWLLGKEAKDAK